MAEAPLTCTISTRFCAQNPATAYPTRVLRRVALRQNPAMLVWTDENSISIAESVMISSSIYTVPRDNQASVVSGTSVGGESTLPSTKSTFSQTFKREMYK